MRDIAKQQDGDIRATAVEQEWHEGTRQCPIGSIPILRTNPSVNYLTGSLFPSPLRAANISTWSGAANAAGPRYEVFLLSILILSVCILSLFHISMLLASRWSHLDFDVGVYIVRCSDCCQRAVQRSVCTAAGVEAGARPRLGVHRDLSPPGRH